MERIRFGILSTAKIAREKVIPAMLKSALCEVYAIGSDKVELAQCIAGKFNIPVVHNSYQAVLDDTSVNAVYIPLPNHLHAEWSIKALKAGKHVLCEKPFTSTFEEAEKVAAVLRSTPHLKFLEAFMYRHHPQWKFVKESVDQGQIGKLVAIQSFFSYNNTDMNNIRNRRDAAGGALMDIGCYSISWSRWLFGAEPIATNATRQFHPVSETDIITAASLQFETGISSFVCSTAMMPYQRVNAIGTNGRIEIEIPVNVPPDSSARVWLHNDNGSHFHSFDPVDQYTLQADRFCNMIVEGENCTAEINDAINNMKVIQTLTADGNV